MTIKITVRADLPRSQLGHLLELLDDQGCDDVATNTKTAVRSADVAVAWQVELDDFTFRQDLCRLVEALMMVSTRYETSQTSVIVRHLDDLMEGARAPGTLKVSGRP